MNDEQKFDVTIRRRGKTFYALIPALKLVVSADTLEGAWREINDKRKRLVDDLAAIDKLEIVEKAATASTKPDGPSQFWTSGLIWKFANWITGAVAAAAIATFILLPSLTQRYPDTSRSQFISFPDGAMTRLETTVSGEVKSARVRGDAILVSGWAHDSSSGDTADEVRLYINGELLAGVKPKTDPEVRRSGSDDRVIPNWFNLTVPTANLKSGDAVQVFAKGKSGWNELAYAGTFPFPHIVSFARELKKLIPDSSKSNVLQAIADKKDLSDLRVTHTNYSSYGTTSAIIPTILGSAKPNDGAGIMGPSFVPKKSGLRYIAHLHLNVAVTDNSEFVIAVFQKGLADPVWISSVPATTAKRFKIDDTFEISTPSESKVELEVRVGIARPGGVAYINGDATGGDNPPSISFIDIFELR